SPMAPRLRIRRGFHRTRRSSSTSRCSTCSDPDGAPPRYPAPLSALRRGATLRGMGASPGALFGLRARVRAKPRRHLGVHDHRRSAARGRDHRADLLRLRPDAPDARAPHLRNPGRRADLDGAEPVGRRHRAPLSFARLLARSVRSGADAAKGPRLNRLCDRVSGSPMSGNTIVPVKQLLGAIVIAAVSCGACSRPKTPPNPLIAASTTMVTAWQIPLDPLKQAIAGDAKLTDQIKWGYRIFVDTPREAPRFTGGTVSCTNCHLNAGQRERALPVVGVAGMFPEYNNRAARLISLADRVVDC